MKLFITKSDAITAGMTHHGVLFGVPSWLKHIDGEGFDAAPKFYPFMLWCIFAAWCFQTASYFVSVDNILIIPVKFMDKIE